MFTRAGGSLLKKSSSSPRNQQAILPLPRHKTKYGLTFYTTQKYLPQTFYAFMYRVYLGVCILWIHMYNIIFYILYRPMTLLRVLTSSSPTNGESSLRSNSSTSSLCPVATPAGLTSCRWEEVTRCTTRLIKVYVAARSSYHA